MITQQKTNINLVPGGIPPIIYVSQFDVQTNGIEFTLYAGETAFTLPSGAGVTVNGKKPDSTGFSYSAASASGSTVRINVTKQMTAVFGDVICELRISSGQQDVGTCNFILRVERSPLDDAVISETVLPLIEQAAEIAATIGEYAETVAQEAAAASQSATAAATSAAAAATDAANVHAQYTSLETVKTNANAAAQAAQDAADTLNDLSAAATTLAAGSSATASYDAATGVITFGIPRGADGATGASGVTTPLAGFFTMWVDPDTGNLYAESADDMSSYFDYDSETGNLYFLTEDE
jgi:hypothetical protein